MSVDSWTTGHVTDDVTSRDVIAHLHRRRQSNSGGGSVCVCQRRSQRRRRDLVELGQSADEYCSSACVLVSSSSSMLGWFGRNVCP